MAGETFLTRQGYEKLCEDLNALRVRKQDLSKEIGEAREKGDLKENAEYHFAREEQAKVIGRMREIEEKLGSARIIEEMGVKPGEVRIGCTVQLKDTKSGEGFTYTLVDGAEADYSKGRISVRSPVAEGLLGHKEGETVSIKLPAGVLSYSILKVSRSL